MREFSRNTYHHSATRSETIRACGGLPSSSLVGSLLTDSAVSGLDLVA